MLYLISYCCASAFWLWEENIFLIKVYNHPLPGCYRSLCSVCTLTCIGGREWWTQLINWMAGYFVPSLHRSWMTIESFLFLKLKNLWKLILTFCCLEHRIHLDCMEAERCGNDTVNFQQDILISEFFYKKANIIVVEMFLWYSYDLKCICNYNSCLFITNASWRWLFVVIVIWQVLSQAFRNRFIELHFDDLPAVELVTILHQKSQLPQSYAKKMVAVMKDLQVGWI